MARLLLKLAALLALLAAVAAFGLYSYAAARLPSIEHLRDVRLQEPLRVYARGGELIAEFGDKRRTPVRYEDLPAQLIQAFLAAEDDRYFEHPGVDYQGLLRAAWALVTTGEKRQGGSTITMQLARSFFLSRAKTYTRKLTEILLALKIEHAFSKQKILELYLNQIYLGHRAYGVAAAADVYYGRRLAQLSLPQMAMLAALPKAPSRVNPIVNPPRAIERRNHVLARMRALNYITETEYQAAYTALDDARLRQQKPAVSAPHFAEWVRGQLVQRYGVGVYNFGLKAYTTLDAHLQAAAVAAVRAGLFAFDRRRAYRGPVQHGALNPPTAPGDHEAVLAAAPRNPGLTAAVVLATRAQAMEVYLAGGAHARLAATDVGWAASAGARGVPRPGDVVQLTAAGNGTWRLAETPRVEGALVALAPADGAVRALVGGYDFTRSKFNRVTQAKRQPGSSFKPFVYSAALAAGYTTASLLDDAPLALMDHGRLWEPENYDGKYHGLIRVREALIHSRNVSSIRLLQAVGLKPAIEMAKQFGFRDAQLPFGLSLVLGTGGVTPLELARAYAVYANGGYRVEPYFIERLESSRGALLEQTQVPVACSDCANAAQAAPQVLGPVDRFLMHSLLRDVIDHGTGQRARRLGRRDVAGKTGTTNDQRDAWFAGYHPDLAVVTWLGYDDLTPLGRGETGAQAALPIWIDFMRVALHGLPQRDIEPPPGVVTTWIDRDSGLATSADDPDAMLEVFAEDSMPRLAAVPVRRELDFEVASPAGLGSAPEAALPEQLF